MMLGNDVLADPVAHGIEVFTDSPGRRTFPMTALLREARRQVGDRRERVESGHIASLHRPYDEPLR